MTPIKSTITPAEILETIKNLPLAENKHADHDPQDRLVTLLEELPESAFVTRVLIYSIGQPDVANDLLEGKMPMHEVCRTLDADVQLIEMDTDTTTPQDNARAVAFGLMAAEQNTGLIVTTAIGPVEEPSGDFFDTATPNIAAVLGTMISGAIAGIPVIAEGPGAIIASDMLAKIRPDMMPYILVCDASDDAKDGPAYAAGMLAAWALSLIPEDNAA